MTTEPPVFRTVADDSTLWWTLADGSPHRLDGPAVVHPDGTQEWWVDSQRHREDGPAVTRPNGYQRWYRHGRLHRVDGPAVVYSNGSRRWYRDGSLHREHGPAVLWKDGAQSWYLNGIMVAAQEPGGSLEVASGWSIDEDGVPHRVEAVL